MADNNKFSDDFYLDSSRINVDDLDFAQAEFCGGSLDGNRLEGGIDALPDEITCHSLQPNGRNDSQRYLLTTTVSSHGSVCDAYYRFQAQLSK